ncbi:acyl-CoA dehydrogenase [Novosphingobium marinum]|uniref:Alkylation response protein AidB-like acyl-CoA dehydrogenase n=1 Tax=Novosphingobium marinum TaxID=1514948 RepID=A0A7Z0BTU4_9SPHN|nr:acyl-CoA dehydrogenase family protein [Novosphingobium marinum]NYH95509.1 alkylation response protein AidB-like acyl-CoA dehydrogenase [Novosphingobium marinum]GGC27611.1 acyl-CoA dehydrogenase [Novosphingobium marinum]
MKHEANLDAEVRRLFAATVEKLAKQHHSIERCRGPRFECSDEEWSAFAEQGVFALGIDPEYGGLGGGISDLAAVMRQIGYNLLAVPFFENAVMAALLVNRFGSADLKESLLPQIAEGSVRMAVALRDPGTVGADANHRAQFAGDTISGVKDQVMDAENASKFLVGAHDVDGKMVLGMIERDSPGLSVQHYRLPDNRIASRLTLDSVVATILAVPDPGDIQAILDAGAVCLASETVGAMAAANRITLDYAKVRRQFGRPIGDFQVLQHRMVDMFIAERRSRAVVDEAAAALDNSLSDRTMAVSVAKAQADKSGRFVAESAIQIHGGMGLTDECAIGHYLKRILLNGSRHGTAAWHLNRLSLLQR